MKANGKPATRRPIEREYLATLNAAVPLDTWQAICKRAAGEVKAHDYVLRLNTRCHLTGPQTVSLAQFRSRPE